MDFDVIIYVLIGIVWIVISIVKANQKAIKKRDLAKTQAKTTLTQNMNHTSAANQGASTSNAGIENWLAELMGVETPKPKQSISEGQENFKNDMAIDSIIENISGQLDTIDAEEGIKTTYPKESSIGSSNFVSQQYENNILSDFDLRKAIIYSEILKRPYN